MEFGKKLQRDLDKEFRRENQVLIALEKALAKTTKPTSIKLGSTNINYNQAHTARISYDDVIQARSVEKKIFSYIKSEIDNSNVQAKLNEEVYKEEARALTRGTFTEKGIISRGRYTKLTPDIQRKVLDKIYKDLYKEVNTGLLNKFEKIDLSGENSSFEKLIKATNELIYDIHKIKAWRKQVESLVQRAELEYKRKTKQIAQGKYTKEQFNKEYILTVDELEAIAEAILGLAIEYCPIRTGFLRSSGKVYINSNYARIIFEAPYAAYVHDNVNAFHPIGRDHFLEQAAQDILPTISVWTEQTGDNKFAQYDWNNTNKKIESQQIEPTLENVTSLMYWNEHTGYQAVYIDIDRNLRINYYHNN